MEAFVWTLDEMRNNSHELAETRKVHYFMGLPYLIAGLKKEDFRYVVLLGDPAPFTLHGEDENGRAVSWEETLRPLLGMVELQVSCYNPNEVWLKYISVREEYQGKGYSSVPIQKIVQCTSSNFPGKCLARTETSEFAPDFIQTKISEKLNAAGIWWSQKRRVYGEFDAVLVTNKDNPNQL